MGQPWDFTPLQISPEDMEFLRLRDQPEELMPRRVCAALGIPPSLFIAAAQFAAAERTLDELLAFYRPLPGGSERDERGTGS